MSIFSVLPARYVGYSSFFDDVARFLETSGIKQYPMHDVIKTDTGYDIEIAVAGFTKEDIEVTLDPSTRALIVHGKKDKATTEKVYSSIASRQFTRTFTIEPNLDVGDITLEHGILRIKLLSKPENKTPLLRLEVK
jgi:molecular chaperone IbpA